MSRLYNGVKYYSDYDMSIGWYLEKAEKVINSFDENSSHDDINYILELYNISLLFDSQGRLNTWNDVYYCDLKSKVNKFIPIIAKYFHNLDILKIKFFYNKISRQYQEDFWRLFSRFKVYEKVKNEEFTSILYEFNVSIYLLLIHQSIVKYFDNEISDYMKHSKLTAVALIKHYLVQKEIKYYIPELLLLEDQLTIIENYINSEGANPNYLKLLYESRSRKEFPIPDKIRLKAKRRCSEIFEKDSISESGFSYNLTVSFSDIKEAIRVYDEDLLNYKVTYSRLWVKDNLDNATLLNNFIYLFEYVDYHIRSTFPSKEYELGFLEKFAGVKGIKRYNIGLAFNFKNMLSLMQIKLYCQVLSEFDKRLENIFKWFFEEYLWNEFGVEGFNLSIPSENSTFLEKVRTVCSEIDSILSQFNVYIENGEIDRELLEISRNSPLIEDIPSFFERKYGYIEDRELLNISEYLFSDQSQLGYIENKASYSNFEELIVNENVLISDFPAYNRDLITSLIEKNIIYKNEQGYIRFEEDITRIIKDFYYNKVICINYYKNSPVLDSLILNGKIICESKLFSRQEQEYLNFLLNDRLFDNGPALRNKYSHGKNPINLEDHEKDYFQILKVITLIIIKINEEFCLRDDNF